MRGSLERVSVKRNPTNLLSWKNKKKGRGEGGSVRGEKLTLSTLQKKRGSITTAREGGGKACWGGTMCLLTNFSGKTGEIEEQREGGLNPERKAALGLLEVLEGQETADYRFGGRKGEKGGEGKNGDGGGKGEL